MRKEHTMKRMIAAGLCALLLCTPAYAAAAVPSGQTDAAQQNASVSLTFEGLEKTVRERNVSIKANNSTVKGEEAADAGAAYLEQYIALSSQIDGYRTQIHALEKTIEGLQDEALRATLTAQLKTLQASLAAAQSSYDALEEQEDRAEEQQEKTVERVKRQMDHAAGLICMEAQDNYITLKGMEDTLAQTARGLAQIDRNLAAVQVQVSIGMTAVNEQKALEAQREILLAEQKSLMTQYDSLRDMLAIQCGYPAGTELALQPLPALAREQAAPDYAKDLAGMLQNSYAVWFKQDAAEQASDDYADGVTNSLHAYDAAKITLEAEKQNASAAFRKLYQDVQQKNTAWEAAQADLALAGKTFHVAEVQYQLGMTSRMAFADAQDTYAAAQETAAAAEHALRTAMGHYDWAKRGVMAAA